MSFFIQKYIALHKVLDFLKEHKVLDLYRVCVRNCHYFVLKGLWFSVNH